MSRHRICTILGIVQAKNYPYENKYTCGKGCAVGMFLRNIVTIGLSKKQLGGPMPESRIDQNKIAVQWKARGFSFGVFIDAPGQVWQDFIHDTDELVMVVQGDLDLEMQGKTIRCDLGQEVFIPAGVLHTVRNVGTTTSRWFYGYKND